MARRPPPGQEAVQHRAAGQANVSDGPGLVEDARTRPLPLHLISSHRQVKDLSLRKIPLASLRVACHFTLTLYRFIQSFLLRPGTVAAIFSHRSGVLTGKVFRACSRSFCSSVVQAAELISVPDAGQKRNISEQTAKQRFIYFGNITGS